MLNIAPPRPDVPFVPLPPSPSTAPTAPLSPLLPTARFASTATDESVTRPPLFNSKPSMFVFPCWIVTQYMFTLPYNISLTRSRLLPSMIVAREPAPLMVRLLVTSRSPLALASSLAPVIVSFDMPLRSLIVLETPFASAAMMAERSGMWPVASLPVRKSTATVSRVVLTWNVDMTIRCSSISNCGHDCIFCRLVRPRRFKVFGRDDFSGNFLMMALLDVLASA